LIMLRYLYGKRFGLKIAWANRKEGDRVGAGCFPPQPVSVLGPTPTWSPSFLLAQAIFEPNLFPYKYPNIFILHAYLPMKMEQCSETSAYKIQMPGNYLEESIQQEITVIQCIQFFLFMVLCSAWWWLYIIETCSWFAHKIKLCLDCDSESILFSLYTYN
jgi:hypothetical protein